MEFKRRTEPYTDDRFEGYRTILTAKDGKEWSFIHHEEVAPEDGLTETLRQASEFFSGEIELVEEFTPASENQINTLVSGSNAV